MPSGDGPLPETSEKCLLSSYSGRGANHQVADLLETGGSLCQVVDKNVNNSERFRYACDKTFHCLFIRDIGDPSAGPDPVGLQVCHSLLELIGLNVCDRDRRPMSAKQPSRRQPDSCGASVTNATNADRSCSFAWPSICVMSAPCVPSAYEL